MQENCTSGLPSGNWKRKGILAVCQPVTAPVVDSTEIAKSFRIPFVRSESRSVGITVCNPLLREIRYDQRVCGAGLPVKGFGVS